ncbi:MAG: DUF4382 domain-containing protein, partial [Candidatus Acidiferrales bacterium]
SIVFLSLGLIRCDNACVLVVSNPGGSIGTVSGNGPSCSLSTTSGTATVRITGQVLAAGDGASRMAGHALGAGDGTSRIQHVFLTLRGIEANSSAAAGDESADWQELAPKLAAQPVQVDLFAAGGDSCQAGGFESAAVRADEYRQIRLRLAPNETDSSEPILEQNSCGSAGFNCIVTSGGDIRPLVLARNVSQIQVTTEHIAGGFFRIFSEASVNLEIEFDPKASQFIPTEGVVQMVPVFTVDSQAWCENAIRTER